MGIKTDQEQYVRHPSIFDDDAMALHYFPAWINIPRNVELDDATRLIEQNEGFYPVYPMAGEQGGMLEVMPSNLASPARTEQFLRMQSESVRPLAEASVRERAQYERRRRSLHLAQLRLRARTRSQRIQQEAQRQSWYALDDIIDRIEDQHAQFL